MAKAWEPPEAWAAFIREWWPIVENDALWAGFRAAFPDYTTNDFSRLTTWVNRQKIKGALQKRPI